jgi:hypothetical protein
MSQTLNPYPYVVNNPVNLTDPSGEFPLVFAMAIGAALGGIFNGLDYYIQNQGCITGYGMAQALIFGATKGMFLGAMVGGTYAWLGIDATVSGLLGGALNMVFSDATSISDSMFDFGVGFIFGVGAYGISAWQAIGAVGRIGSLAGLNVLEAEATTWHYKKRNITFSEGALFAFLGLMGGGIGEGVGIIAQRGINLFGKTDDLARKVTATDWMMAEEFMAAFDGMQKKILRDNQIKYGFYKASDVIHLIWANAQIRKQFQTVLGVKLPYRSVTAETMSFLFTTIIPDAEIYSTLMGLQ